MQNFQFYFGLSECHGGLPLFYNDDFKAIVLFKNNRVIDVEAEIQRKKVFLTFVYGYPVINYREHVWERLTQIGIYRSNPWFRIEDFNELIGNQEKQGEVLSHLSSPIPFNLMIMNYGILEFPCFCDKMTWRGRRNKKVVRCRLDRALANEDWHSVF